MDRDSKAHQTVEIQISYSPYTIRLYSELETYIASLRNILSTLRDKTYHKVGAKSTRGGFLGLNLSEQNYDADEIEKGELQKALVNISRSLTDFIDAVLGIDSVLKNPPRLTFTDVEQYKKLLESSIKKRILNIASNGRLSSTKKISMLPELPRFTEKTLIGCFEARHSIEHNKSIARTDFDFVIQKQSLFTSKGIELNNFPVTLKGPDTISIKFDEVVRKIKKGSEIRFTELELENLYMTIHTRVVPEIISKLVPKK